MFAYVTHVMTGLVVLPHPHRHMISVLRVVFQVVNDPGSSHFSISGFCEEQEQVRALPRLGAHLAAQGACESVLVHQREIHSRVEVDA